MAEVARDPFSQHRSGTLARGHQFPGRFGRLAGRAADQPRLHHVPDGQALPLGLSPTASSPSSSATFDAAWASGPRRPDALDVHAVPALALRERPRPRRGHQGYDRLYVPQAGHTTGDLDVHDIAVDADGRLVFVVTRFNCLATLSERDSFTPLWRPPFVDKLGAPRTAAT